MCPSVEDPDLVFHETGYSQSRTHSRPVECSSRQAIQARPDHPARVVSPARGLPVDMQQVAPTSDGSICQIPWLDALSLSWEDLDPCAFPPAAHLSKVVAKLQVYPYRRIIVIALWWPNMPWFWDLVAMSSQIPLCLPNLLNLLTQHFN